MIFVNEVYFQIQKPITSNIKSIWIYPCKIGISCYYVADRVL